MLHPFGGNNWVNLLLLDAPHNNERRRKKAGVGKLALRSDTRAREYSVEEERRRGAPHECADAKTEKLFKSAGAPMPQRLMQLRAPTILTSGMRIRSADTK